MYTHPVNLAGRFLLEIAALVALGCWGWQHSGSWIRFILAIGIPAFAALIWGTFRVPNDPGPAPVAVPGSIRLLIECLFFASASYALYSLKYHTVSWALVIILIIHYMVSYDRILWMLRR